MGTLKLGQARGIALLVPAQAGLVIGEYAPNKVKKTLGGLGIEPDFVKSNCGYYYTERLEQVKKELSGTAGNFYINDKPTGAVVGQQPFGGSRASGTNDKAGSYLNLIRWVSPRTIKETFVPPTHFAYPYMLPED